MKRLLILASAAILILALISGCSAASTTAGQDSPGPQSTTTYASNDGAGEPIGDLPAAIRKVIKNVELYLEAKDVQLAYDSILAYAEQHGGYEFNRSQQTSGDVVTINAQIKINPDQLSDLIAYIGSVCKLNEQRTSSEDITSDYYDAKTRLATMEKALLTYYTFLEDAKTIDESLKVQNQINDLTLQIESLKGQISLWDNLLAESTVTINLRQTTDPVVAKREINWSTLSFGDMGYLMQSGLTWLLNIIVVVLQWAAIIIVITSPLWIITLLVIWLVCRRRRRRNLAAKAASEQPQSPEQANSGEQGES